jgi:hypothetical protein
MLYVAQFAAIVLFPGTLFSQTESPSVITTTEGQVKKPNILVIMGDDIGCTTSSIYHRGDMGYGRQTSIMGRKCDVHVLVWSAECTRDVPRSSPAVADSHRINQGWPAGRGLGLCVRGPTIAGDP